MPVPFHNRDRERAAIDSACDSRQAEQFIIYGRRGVGKSALLAEVLTTRQHIYFRALRRTLPLQLEALTAAVREAFPDEYVPGIFSGVEEFLGYLVHLATRRAPEPVIAVIDELPYLAKVDQGLLTVMQHWWDRNKQLSNLKMFLTGSYVSFMEREVLSINAPLYNRRTGSLKLEPLRYFEAALFFPEYTAQEQLEVFAVLGGMPSYLEQFDASVSIDQNLLRTALRPSTYLNEEPDWLLRQDLRNEVTYGSILQAMATGNRRPSDIARAIGKQSAQDVAPRLQCLREIDIVRREVPVTERERPYTRTSLYWLADNYLAFWYRYVGPNQGLIAEGRGERVLERIKQSFGEYVSRPPFEEICRQFLRRAYTSDRLPADLEFNAVGSWWDGSAEIDVLAQDGSVTTLAGSCKWIGTPVGLDELHRLQLLLEAKSNALNPSATCWYALFAREGFTTELQAWAAQPANRTLLFGVHDLMLISDA